MKNSFIITNRDGKTCDLTHHILRGITMKELFQFLCISWNITPKVNSYEYHLLRRNILKWEEESRIKRSRIYLNSTRPDMFILSRREERE